MRWSRAVLAILFIVLLVPPALGAAPVAPEPAGDGTALPARLAMNSGDGIPAVRVLESDDDGLLLDVQVAGLATSQVEQAGTVYTRLYLPYSGATSALGRPELPTFGRYIALPRGAQVEVEVVQASFETVTDLLIYPAQEPHLDCTGAQEAPFVIDESFYREDTVFPGMLAMADEVKSLRGVDLTVLRFFPFQYNPARRELMAYSHLQVRVRFLGGQGTFADPSCRAESFETLYSQLLLNYEQLGAPPAWPGPQSPTGAVFLIITHPNYVGPANDLAAFRNSQGIDTEVRTTSETGSTAAQIQAYIQTAYDTWNPRPEYVLLVGDHEWVPTNDSGGTDTDLYYYTVDGSDYYPDIHGGRISVDTVNQAQKAIDDIIAYDQNPVTDPAFYQNVTVAAYFQDDNHDDYEDRRFVRTSEEVRDYLMSEGFTVERIYMADSDVNPTHYNNGYYGNGEPLPPELLRPGFAWDGDTADITAAVQAGRFILNHRDHGSPWGWSEPYYHINDVLGLTNGNLLPVVFSMNCSSGAFTSSTYDPCFAEAWERNPNGGAVGVVAASRTSYSGYNDWMCNGIYDAIWPDYLTQEIPGFARPERHVAAAMNYGKFIMEMIWGNPWGYQQIEFEMFHWFGDPTMQIHIGPPFADFTIAADPDSLAVCAPEVATSTVQIGQILGYAHDVTLAALDVPAGTTASFTPPTVTPPGESTLTLDVGDTTADGTYTLVVSGTAEGTNVHTVEVELLVSSDVPGAPALIHPPDGAADQPYQGLTFTWGLLPQVQAYGLQVDNHPDFSAPVVDKGGISAVPYTLDVPLDEATCYFWRAMGENACGPGDWAEPFSFATAALVITFFDDIESGGGNWTHQAAQGSDHWAISTAQSHSPTHAWYVPDDGVITDSRLWNVTPVPVGNGGVLTFWHRYNFEASYDGSVLEISTDGGSTWTDLGPYITANGYNGTISTAYSNPLGGRQAWVSDLTEWTQVEVDLSAYAGDDVQVRWRIGCDSGVSDTGWYIDDVLFSSPLPPGPPPVLQQVVPSVGPPDAPTPVQIHGSGFMGHPIAGLDHTWLLSVTLVSSTTLEAVVPAGMAEGAYTLTVYSGDCQTAVLPNAFLVITQCPTPTVAIASDSPVMLGEPMHLTATIVTGTAPFFYDWDLGGAGSGTGLDTATPVYTYTDPGQYLVTLVLTDACGTAVATTTVEVLCDPPVGDFASDSPVLLGAPMHFTATVGGMAPMTYTWDMGGPGSGTGLDTPQPVYTYTAVGTYTVTMTVENPCAVLSVTHPVEVWCDPPVASFTSNSPVLLGEPMAFASTVTGTGPFTYSWDFGDHVGWSAAANPVYTYTASGAFTVTLLVGSPCGPATFADTVLVEAVLYRIYIPLVFRMALP